MSRKRTACSIEFETKIVLEVLENMQKKRGLIFGIGNVKYPSNQKVFSLFDLFSLSKIQKLILKKLLKLLNRKSFLT